MAIFTKQYLEEVYKSKYASYLDDDEEEEKDEDEKEDKKESSTPQHLSKTEIVKARNQALMILGNFNKLKKCCDTINLGEKDHINDEGERESSFGKYYSDPADAFIKLMDGDVFSGYPDFRSGGNEAFEKDSKEYIKTVNDSFKRVGIKAKFMEGPNRDDEAISFGIKSLKEK